MLILVILLLVCVFVMGAYIILAKREVKNIAHQMNEIMDTETNMIINSSFVDSDLINLINVQNHYIKLCQDIIRENEDVKQTLKITILNMSHDLRTPLTSIQGYLELLNMEEVALGKKEKYLAIISDRIHLLHNMIEDFFELAKVESNSFPITFKYLNVHTILAECLALYYEEFQQKNITLHTQLDDSLFISVDEHAIRRVFHNIIGNIVKHNATNAQITTYKKENYVFLDFMNDTENINENNVSMLFDKFFTASSSRTEKNTGLGLAISRELVNKMYGEINAFYDNGNVTISIKFPINNKV